jgi:mono/diheme cytochrome c family protein
MGLIRPWRATMCPMSPSPQSRLTHLGAAAIVAITLAALLAACGSGSAAKSSGARLTLLERGKQLYAADGCEDCHSLNGKPGSGPTWKGLYGGAVELSSGRTVTADVAYLTKHIVDPNAMTVRGFPGSVMAEAIQSDGLAGNPADVRALVALIKSLK